MDAAELHDLVHRDAAAAWPHVVELIETGAQTNDVLTLLEDVVYSDQLPELIDEIEAQARKSQKLRLALLTCGPALGGRGGPEMDRISKLIQSAEDELATVYWFNDESELRSLSSFRKSLPATLQGKHVIFKRRSKSDET